MKRILRGVARWSIPPGIHELLQDASTRWQSGMLRKPNLADNKILKDSHTGARCFVLGTGPSIRLQDLKPLRDELCISVANFFVHPDYDYIRPRYHCVAPFHSPFTDQDSIRWLRTMEPHLEYATLFLGYSAKRLIDGNGLFKGRDVHYLEFGERCWKSANDEFDISSVLPGCQSVSIIALILALYLGCREVYLLGTDHTFFNTDNGRYDYGHFYDGKATNELGEEAAPADLENNFRSAAELWREYKAIRDHASTKNVTICNATQGGILDVFPRVSYESVICGRRK